MASLSWQGKVPSKQGENISFPSKDLPSLYRRASKRAAKAQNAYFRLVYFYLLLLIMAAALTSIIPLVGAYKGWLTFISSGLFVAGICLSLLLFIKKPEGKWYGARAVAESVKTLAWRYMMGAEPFFGNIPVVEVDSLFAGRLSEIVGEKKELSWELVPDPNTEGQITPQMRIIRNKKVEEKKEIYQKYRILNQMNWYSDNCKKNSNKYGWWLAGIFICLVLALVASIVVFHLKTDEINPAPTLATIAASVMAWIQAKRFQELAQSYGVTATEISIIMSKMNSLTNEDEIVAFVEEAEKAFSREHTLWVARRGQR